MFIFIDFGHMEFANKHSELYQTLLWLISWFLVLYIV